MAKLSQTVSNAQKVVSAQSAQFIQLYAKMEHNAQQVQKYSPYAIRGTIARQNQVRNNNVQLLSIVLSKERTTITSVQMEHIALLNLREQLCAQVEHSVQAHQTIPI